MCWDFQIEVIQKNLFEENILNFPNKKVAKTISLILSLTIKKANTHETHSVDFIHSFVHHRYK